MTRKSQKVIHWTLFGFRTIKAIFRKAPFLRYHPAYLTLFWWIWSLVRACKSNYDFFWLFWHRPAQLNQEIQYLTQFEPGRWGFLVWTWTIVHDPLFADLNYGPTPSLPYFKQRTPISLNECQILNYFIDLGCSM